MAEPGNRFDRNERLFGKRGQDVLRGVTVLVVGIGGLGTHVVQQLALLGIGAMALVDKEELSRSNRNRYVGAWDDDPIPGSYKVDLGKRLAHLIDPSIEIRTVPDSLLTEKALRELCAADFVFGCVDNAGVRLVLNEACLAYDRPLFDLASDVPEPGRYGGRVTVVWGDGGCLHCRGLLDLDEARRFLSPADMRENEDAVYGVNRRALDEAGPSVVSLNGVVASLAVMEFMAAITGMRSAYRNLEYRGHMGIVAKRADDPSEGCYYCQGVRGLGEAAGIRRYFSISGL